MNSKILLALMLPLTAACGKEVPATNREPKPAPTSADSVSPGPIAGRIAGDVFQVKNARYYVDTRPGYEKFEIHFAAQSPPNVCDDLGPLHATTLWLRRTGPGGPKPETARFDGKEASAWEAHYERFQAGKWAGDGNASALVALHPLTADAKLEGQLAVCFGDAEGSCVQGEFSAVYCPIRIDTLVRGTRAMEVPGSGAGADWQPAQTPTAAETASDASAPDATTD